MCTEWYILISGSVFIDGAMFLPKSCFGQPTPGSFVRHNECLVLEPTDLLVIPFNRDPHSPKSPTSPCLNGSSFKRHCSNTRKKSSASRTQAIRSTYLPIQHAEESDSTDLSTPTQSDNPTMTSISPSAPLAVWEDDLRSPKRSAFDFNNSEMKVNYKSVAKEALMKAPEARTSEDVDALVSAFKPFSSLSQIPPQTLRSLCSRGRLSVVPESDICVLNHNQPITDWHLIVNGAVDRYHWPSPNEESSDIEDDDFSADNSSVRVTRVTRLGVGQTFGLEPGERLPQIQYGQIITATRDCRFFCLPVTDFSDLLAGISSRSSDINRSCLRQRSDPTSNRISRDEEGRECETDSQGQPVEVREIRGRNDDDNQGYVIIRATPNKLIDHLVESENPLDETYIDDFLLTHRVFLPGGSVRVMDRLYHIFQDNMPPSEGDPMVCHRVVRVLTRWAKRHFEDFEETQETMTYLQKFSHLIEDCGMINELLYLYRACSQSAKVRSISMRRVSLYEPFGITLIAGSSHDPTSGPPLGILVSHVTPGSLAWQAGLGEGDEVLEVNTRATLVMPHTLAVELVNQALNISLTVRSNLENYYRIKNPDFSASCPSHRISCSPSAFPKFKDHGTNLGRSPSDALPSNQHLAVSLQTDKVSNQSLPSTSLKRLMLKKKSGSLSEPSFDKSSSRSRSAHNSPNRGSNIPDILDSHSCTTPNSPTCITGTANPILTVDSADSASYDALAPRARLSSSGEFPTDSSSNCPTLQVLSSSSNCLAPPCSGSSPPIQIGSSIASEAAGDGVIRVYYRGDSESSGTSQTTNGSDSGVSTGEVYLMVQGGTRAQEVVMLTLTQLGVVYSRSEDYLLCEVSVDLPGPLVRHRVLKPEVHSLVSNSRLGSRYYIKNRSHTNPLTSDADVAEMLAERRVTFLDLPIPELAIQVFCEAYVQLCSVKPGHLLQVILTGGLNSNQLHLPSIGNSQTSSTHSSRHSFATADSGVDPGDTLAIDDRTACSVSSDAPISPSKRASPSAQTPVSSVGGEAVDRFLSLSNRYLYWVVTEITSENSGASRRAKIIKRFIRLARLCRDIHNVETFFAIINGLESGHVKRLKSSWEKVPNREMKQFKSLLSLLDLTGNMRLLRSLHTAPPPVIPMAALVTKDLTALHEAQPTWTHGNTMVHFDKLRQLAARVRSLTRHSDQVGGSEGLDPYYVGLSIARDRIKQVAVGVSSSGASVGQTFQGSTGNTSTNQQSSTGDWWKQSAASLVQQMTASAAGSLTLKSRRRSNILNPKRIFEEQQAVKRVRLYLDQLNPQTNEDALRSMSHICEPPPLGQSNVGENSSASRRHIHRRNCSLDGLTGSRVGPVSQADAQKAAQILANARISMPPSSSPLLPGNRVISKRSQSTVTRPPPFLTSMTSFDHSVSPTSTTNAFTPTQSTSSSRESTPILIRQSSFAASVTCNQSQSSVTTINEQRKTSSISSGDSGLVSWPSQSPRCSSKCPREGEETEQGNSTPTSSPQMSEDHLKEFVQTIDSTIISTHL